jgi:hypothetical protein
MAKHSGRFLPIRPFNDEWVSKVDRSSGVYIVYDLAGPIYVGRSAVDIHRRLHSHLIERGNQVIAQAMRIGAASSLTFTYCLLPRADQANAEAVFIRELGSAEFANLRRETSDEDWNDSEVIDSLSTLAKPSAPMKPTGPANRKGS